MAQYTLDVSLASSASDASLQSILSYLNPSLGGVSSVALEEFQQQLMALTPTGTGTVYLTGVQADPNSVPDSPLFDIKATGGPNEEIMTGSGFDTITGVAGDTLDGSTSASGGARLNAGAGAEALNAGAGADTLNAGSGYDTLSGGTGDDSLVGSSSRAGHALIYSGSGNNTIQAGEGSDTIYAENGDDTIKGGSGASTVYAGSGHDSVYGGSGPTTFVVTAANFNNDLFQGGTGASILDLSDLNKSDVSVHTNATTHVTTVTFDGATITLKGVNEIAYANHTTQTLH